MTSDTALPVELDENALNAARDAFEYVAGMVTSELALRTAVTAYLRALSATRTDHLSADRDRLIHTLVVHFHMFRDKAEEAADLFLHDKTLRTEGE